MEVIGDLGDVVEPYVTRFDWVEGEIRESARLVFAPSRERAVEAFRASDQAITDEDVLQVPENIAFEWIKR